VSRIKKMSSSARPDAAINKDDLDSFHECLKKSNRILALLGAGLSASSGLPTFRGKEATSRSASSRLIVD
jgi:hypothetical protein